MSPHPGFHSLHEETAATLSVEGTLPDWLTGSLVRNGPGAFSFPDGSTVEHWFDGLAMLHRFTFDPDTRSHRAGGAGKDELHYRNRFLDTDAYRAALAGDFEGGFATGETTLRSRLSTFLTDPYDNTNIIVERIGETYLALTESPRWVAVDPNTLATDRHVEYDGSAPSGHLACAHLKRDPVTGTLVNVETEFGRTNQYHVHAMSEPGVRHHIGSVETDEPAYMHSFALTPRFVVLTEFPLRVNPLRFLRPGRQAPFIEQFEWQPDRGTRVIVIDRTTGEVLADPVTDSVFGFHHVNAFERDGGREIVFDLETVPDATTIDSLSIDSLREGELETLAGRLDRFTVDLGGATGSNRYGADDVSVDRSRLYADGTALPTASPARWSREHRYIYAMSMDQPPTEWAHGILKLDTRTGDVTEFSRGGDYFGEPIFVPAPDGDREDAGVVLTVALDAGENRSRLLVVDGDTFEENARVTLPHPIPFDFHGRYFPELKAKTPG
ncbi:carotenoid oxygenase family protein [Halorientalis salina]|uniref:carotenoid oxygenase family protein n=1 Tax=Halorientalis salina TaxID=2932266 RepID=UPI0010AB9868|nr:carotenoid oxygenase family protein [Halorientalis salina]